MKRCRQIKRKAGVALSARRSRVLETGAELQEAARRGVWRNKSLHYAANGVGPDSNL